MKSILGLKSGAAWLPRLAVVLLTLASTACLPTNNLKSLNTSSNGTSSTTSGGGTTSSSDSAQAPCTLYDIANPTRGICVGCFQSILRTSCPGKSTFASCADPTVRNSYINMINQCIVQTTTAGFTCALTSCPSGQILNATTCRCDIPAPSPTQTGGTLFIDSGQTNFGPPIVSVPFPSTGGLGNNLVASGNSVNDCRGTFPLNFSILNRGNTVFRLNQYGTPQSSAVANPAGAGYIPVVLPAPRALTNSEIASAPPGSNAQALIEFHTGGVNELGGRAGFDTAPTGANISYITTVSGDGTASLTGDTTAATGATWTSPGFGARDVNGNIYFTDAVAHVARVICYSPSANHPFCPSNAAGIPGVAITAGTIRHIAGVNGSAGNPTEGNPATSERLNSPHGIAVDSNNNVYIASSGSHAIYVICGATDAGRCHTAAINGGTATFNGGAAGVLGEIFVVAGNPGTSGSSNNLVDADFFSGNISLNFPMGIDVETNGDWVNIYVADFQNHRIRVLCEWTSGACTAGTNRTLLGDGTAGYNNINNAAASGSQAFLPTDVKLNWNKNLVFADSRNHLIRAICVTATTLDFCSTATGPTTVVPVVLTLVGTTPISGVPQPGSNSNGVLGPSGSITYPTQIAIAKKTADDVVAATPLASTPNFNNFRDNNFVFTQRLLPGSLLLGQATPLAIPGLTNIVNMHMGFGHTCAQDSTGRVSCVGDNINAQMGNPAATNPQSDVLTPSNLPIGRGHLGGGTEQTCSANNAGGGLLCWGRNSSGQFGNNSTQNPSAPTGVSTSFSLGTFSSATLHSNRIFGGESHLCYVNEGANWGGNTGIFCSGDNSFGQLGEGGGTFTSRTQLQATGVVTAGIAGMTSGSDFAAGANHNCMEAHIGANSEIYCWGGNGSGQLGSGVAGTPARLDTPTLALGPIANADFQIAAEGDHTCAVDRNTDILYCWGSNTSGESLTGTTSASVDAPTQVATSVDEVALGISHGCLLDTSGRVLCWGTNAAGQLGNDEVPSSLTPLQVVGLPAGTVQHIFAGGNQTCATITLTSTGATVPYCWGDNRLKPLGNPTANTSASGNLLSLYCGDNRSLAANTGVEVKSIGLCRGVTTPGTVFTVAGAPGAAGLGTTGTGDGGFARFARFASIYGVTYDGMKNLIVSSGGFADANGIEHADFSLRLIQGEVIGPLIGAKYSFTDSNNLTSHYCFRAKAGTRCDSSGTCSCRMAQPTDEVNTNFWINVRESDTCP